MRDRSSSNTSRVSLSALRGWRRHRDEQDLPTSAAVTDSDLDSSRPMSDREDAADVDEIEDKELGVTPPLSPATDKNETDSPRRKPSVAEFDPFVSIPDRIHAPTPKRSALNAIDGGANGRRIRGSSSGSSSMVATLFPQRRPTIDSSLPPAGAQQTLSASLFPSRLQNNAIPLRAQTVPTRNIPQTQVSHQPRQTGGASPYIASHSLTPITEYYAPPPAYSRTDPGNRPRPFTHPQSHPRAMMMPSPAPPTNPLHTATAAVTDKPRRMGSWKLPVPAFFFQSLSRTKRALLCTLILVVVLIIAIVPAVVVTSKKKKTDMGTGPLEGSWNISHPMLFGEQSGIQHNNQTAIEEADGCRGMSYFTPCYEHKQFRANGAPGLNFDVFKTLNFYNGGNKQQLGYNAVFAPGMLATTGDAQANGGDGEVTMIGDHQRGRIGDEWDFTKSDLNGTWLQDANTGCEFSRTITLSISNQSIADSYTYSFYEIWTVRRPTSTSRLLLQSRQDDTTICDLGTNDKGITRNTDRCMCDWIGDIKRK